MKRRKSVVSWCVVFAVVLVMGLVSQHAYAGNAEGQLTVAGDTVQLQYAYATAQPGFFDETKEDIVVIVTTITLSDEVVEDEWERRDVEKSVEITINAEQRPISVSINHPAFQASPSGMSTEYILELKTFDEKNIEGKFYCKTEKEFFDTAYTFDFTFQAEIHRKEKLPPPTEAEKEAAAKSPQAAVYLEFVKATHAGDIETLKKVLAADVAKELDGPDGKDMLEFMQLFTPPTAEFQRIIEEGETATLMVNAQHEGQELVGTIEFIKEGDTWRVMMSDWEENPDAPSESAEEPAAESPKEGS